MEVINISLKIKLKEKVGDEPMYNFAKAFVILKHGYNTEWEI